MARRKKATRISIPVVVIHPDGSEYDVWEVFLDVSLRQILINMAEQWRLSAGYYGIVNRTAVNAQRESSEGILFGDTLVVNEITKEGISDYPSGAVRVIEKTVTVQFVEAV